MNSSENLGDGQDPPTTSQPKARPRSPFRLSRLMLKELRETLRDRRTLITLILMPLLVYPALSLVFKTFLLGNLQGLTAVDPVSLRIVFDGDGSDDENLELLKQFRRVVHAADRAASANENKDDQGPARLSADNPFPGLKGLEEHRWFQADPDSDLPLESYVQSPPDSGENPQADVCVYFSKSKESSFGFKAKIIHGNNGFSRTAGDYLSYCFRRANDFETKLRFRQLGLPTDPVWLTTKDEIGESSGTGLASLAGLIPLVLVLMTITGAVYPAIDLTAGERERGTLETLMAAPIPRFSILFSKFVAVVTVAMLTAILNLVGMFATIWAFQLDKQLGIEIFNLSTMVQILLLLVLFAGFFSAVLLVVTSFAKSFKEAQVYLIPVILLSLGPGLMAMAPEMKLSGFNLVCPMVNILLLARDVITGGVEAGPATVVVLSTIVYGVIALGFAAKLFGSDAIVNADASGLKEMVMRPKRTNGVAPLGAATFCALLLVPMNFASSELLNRIGVSGASATDIDVDFTQRFTMLACLLFVMFVLFPAVVAYYQRTDFKTGFGLQVPKPIFLIGGLLLGLSLWPIVMWLTTVWHDLYGVFAGVEARDAWSTQLVEATVRMAEKIRSVPWWVVGFCLAIAPAVCEEFFFRGMLQRSLLKNGTPWKAIVISALVFGGFHTINNSVIAIDRLIPTTLVGFVLGYLAYKSDSILPGILLHAIHNGCVSYLAYFQKQLEQQPWFPGDEQLPLTWVGVAALVALAGLAMVVVSKRSADDALPKVERLI